MFYHMCVLFSAEENTDLVKESKSTLDQCILRVKDVTLGDSAQGTEKVYVNGDANAKTIAGQVTIYTHL